MSKISLRLEASAGFLILDVIKDTVEFVNRVGIPAWVKLNDVETLVCPGDDPEKLNENVRKAHANRLPYKYANGR